MKIVVGPVRRRAGKIELQFSSSPDVGRSIVYEEPTIPEGHHVLPPRRSADKA